MIRGAVYRVDLGDAKRGHEQRGKRYGLVLSPSDMPWSVATVIPTSPSAQPAVFRPELAVAGQPTRFLIDTASPCITSTVMNWPRSSTR